MESEDDIVIKMDTIKGFQDVKNILFLDLDASNMCAHFVIFHQLAQL